MFRKLTFKASGIFPTRLLANDRGCEAASLTDQLSPLTAHDDFMM